jgi:hypothetical protein
MLEDPYRPGYHFAIPEDYGDAGDPNGAFYANDRQAICRRVYPGRDDSLRLVLFAKGGKAAFRSVKAWDMMPSNPY